MFKFKNFMQAEALAKHEAFSQMTKESTNLAFWLFEQKGKMTEDEVRAAKYAYHTSFKDLYRQILTSYIGKGYVVDCKLSRMFMHGDYTVQ